MSPILPADIYCHILDYVDQKTAVNCRLLNVFVLPIATTYAFRHIRIEAWHENRNFINVATSPIKHHVREITIDTWAGPDRKGQATSDHKLPRNLSQPLLYLRHFRDIKTLNIRFDRRCGRESRRGEPRIDQDYDFRFKVLDIAFQYLAGTRSAGWEEEPKTSVDCGPVEIKTLTIANLADYNDERLTKSEAFKQVMSSASLTDVRLLGTTGDSTASLEDNIWLPEKHDFFETIPSTWLCPPVAQNLRVLSLFFRDYWGWNPKMDFRSINPVSGLKTGLPNLRVLALGNYVFSHEWQVDWIASVGERNGRGGLQELYLDDCPIMWQARTLEPLDESETVIELPDGKSLSFSNAGYPSKDVMSSPDPVWNPTKFSYHLRWKQILDHWQEHMMGLQVFSMGHGPWDGEAAELMMLPSSPETSSLVPKLRPNAPGWREEIEEIRKLREYREHPALDTMHLNYACPSPSDMRDSGDRSRYYNGVGLAHERPCILQYVHFDIGVGPTPWIERDNARTWFEDGNMEAYEVARREDEASYETLQAAVAQRNLPPRSHA
ncbi:hypothetical protein PFICI_02246 [Pestalotiopsis fici W106-1]|uniref:F-box domain-containing protein n=1 Tax=Pestalotiopsis fici (strain W106-1 / CGMCC3.15140) TaxID=1229662 RepID=W3XGB1_PESFW|nr:uncharacterized protein PFICI_02246 [Pestalotiopsis fici W106-1]ETS84221.1 hypothetical protein PFICI_02246 [Pestalotiopsis fici W106-1]